MSLRAQTVLIWWAWIFMMIFGFTYWLLIGLLPPLDASLPAADVAAFYAQNSFKIRVGTLICSWVSAFMVPFSVVVYFQMRRIEQGTPVWSVLQLVGGCLMSMFLVWPPIFWGVAAFNPGRAPEVTALMHELANLTLVTTDQYFIFQMVAMAVITLRKQVVEHSAFPRWTGYFTIWAALMFEVGAVGFLPKSGPFSWNGLFVFWCPFVIFGTWVTTISITMLRAIKLQKAAAG
jgi:hypothetical protein